MAGGIGRYRLQRVVSTEGTTTVHEAVDTETQQRVAVRLLPVDAALATDERERMTTTALEAVGLQHPGIVELHDFGWDGDTAYAATAFVEGETLAQYLARAGRLPALQGLSLALQLLAALAAAHERGQVHSALNPQHVLMGRNGQLRIEGFGWVAAAASAHRRPGVFDVPAYMAPEQILGRPADCRADLYSAAVVAYELLTGSWPYQAHSAPRPPRALRRELPAALDAVFERAQAQNPEARYRNAAELAAALQAAFGITPPERALVPVRTQRVTAAEPPPRVDVPAEPDETEPEEPAAVRRRRAGIALVAGLGTAVVLGALFVGVESVRGPAAAPAQSAAASGPSPSPAPSPVVAAPAPPPALPPVQAVPAAASIEAPKKPELQAKTEPAPAPAPVSAKTRPAEPRPRKAVERTVARPAESGVREIIVPEAIEAPRDSEPPPRPRETVERSAPQRAVVASDRNERERDRPERPTRTTAVMAAPPSPSPLNSCRQEFSMARDLCVAYECASSEYRRHPVCVRWHADAVVRHKLNQRNGP